MRTITAFVAFIALAAATLQAQDTTTTNPAPVTLDSLLKEAPTLTETMIAAFFAEDTAALRGAQRELGATRTDQHVTANSTSAKAMTTLERPGIVDLLAVAIERGAINSAKSGDAVTLTTTPYFFATAFGANDSPQNFERHPLARKIGLSATFSSDPVSEGDFSTFESGEAKWVILGQRSARDEKLLSRLRPAMSVQFTDAAANFNQCPVPPLEKIAAFNEQLQLPQRPKVEDLRASLADLLKDYSPEDRKRCVDAVQRANVILGTDLVKLKRETDKYLKTIPHQLSLAGSFARDSKLSDFYASKLIYAYDQGDGALVFNANLEAAWNRHRVAADGTTALRSLRDYGAVLGLNTQRKDDGLYDLASNVKWARDKKPGSKSSVIGEAKVNLYLPRDLKLPLSLTYATEKTQTTQRGWQLNIGFAMIFDDLLSRALPGGQ